MQSCATPPKKKTFEKPPDSAIERPPLVRGAFFFCPRSRESEREREMSGKLQPSFCLLEARYPPPSSTSVSCEKNVLGLVRISSLPLLARYKRRSDFATAAAAEKNQNFSSLLPQPALPPVRLRQAPRPAYGGQLNKDDSADPAPNLGLGQAIFTQLLANTHMHGFSF